MALADHLPARCLGPRQLECSAMYLLRAQSESPSRFVWLLCPLPLRGGDCLLQMCADTPCEHQTGSWCWKKTDQRVTMSHSYLWGWDCPLGIGHVHLLGLLFYQSQRALTSRGLAFQLCVHVGYPHLPRPRGAPEGQESSCLLGVPCTLSWGVDNSHSVQCVSLIP